MLTGTYGERGTHFTYNLMWMYCCEGTVQYISPEQIRGRYRFTGDIWAVGVICYLLLTGIIQGNEYIV